jgi:hypothetical protein
MMSETSMRFRATANARDLVELPNDQRAAVSTRNVVRVSRRPNAVETEPENNRPTTHRMAARP